MWSGNWYGAQHLSVEMETRNWCLQYCEVVAYHIATTYALILFFCAPIMSPEEEEEEEEISSRKRNASFSTVPRGQAFQKKWITTLVIKIIKKDKKPFFSYGSWFVVPTGKYRRKLRDSNVLHKVFSG